MKAPHGTFTCWCYAYMVRHVAREILRLCAVYEISQCLLCPLDPTCYVICQRQSNKFLLIFHTKLYIPYCMQSINIWLVFSLVSATFSDHVQKAVKGPLKVLQVLNMNLQLPAMVSPVVYALFWVSKLEIRCRCKLILQCLSVSRKQALVVYIQEEVHLVCASLTAGTTCQCTVSGLKIIACRQLQSSAVTWELLCLQR